MRIVSFLVFLLYINSVFSQEIKEVNNIVGTAIISGNISPNNAKIMALNDAKINALKKAGIVENISSFQLLYSSQQKNDYTQFFTSDIQTEMNGAVKNYTITSDKLITKNNNELLYEVIINAEVILYSTKPDFSYTAKIDGLRSAYFNQENLNFDVTTSQDSYLKIFNITDPEATLIYPNNYEKDRVIKANTLLKFPIENIDYALEIKLKKETNRLIFVFTKSPVSFIKLDKNQITTQEDIFSWIYTIPPDLRRVEYKSFLVEVK